MAKASMKGKKQSKKRTKRTDTSTAEDITQSKDPFALYVIEPKASYHRKREGPAILSTAFQDEQHGIRVYNNDCLDVLSYVAEQCPEGCVDMIFADPPYFLSNGGITCQAGKMVSVDKGRWDKSQGPDLNHQFNRTWLAACQRALKPNGTIWVSGTSHIIYSIGFAMQQLGFKLLNDICWVKPNPPPNLSCRYFTHATEIVLWAAKNSRSKHTFQYQEMRRENGGKQMKSTWEILPPTKKEKRFGKHPTQKPVLLLDRIIRASSNPGDLILDPFMGSGTTGVAAVRLARGFVGIETEQEYIETAKNRLEATLQELQDDLFMANHAKK